MSGRLNLESVQSYSKKFAKTASDKYFVTKDTITGNEILSFCSVSQVNLMIVKLLLNKWKEQGEQIKSPYFNFENDQVKIAYTNLMNLLSQNIQVQRAAFEDLTAEAVYQSLVLAIEPANYFLGKVEEVGKKVITKTDLKEILKYIQINNYFVEEATNRMVNQFISSEDFMQLQENVIRENLDKLYNPSLFISELSSVAPVSISELVIMENVTSTVTKTEETVTVSVKEVEVTVAKNIFSEIENTVTVKTSEQTEVYKQETKVEEPTIGKVDVLTSQLINEEQVVSTLNDRFADDTETSTLNDRLKKEGENRATLLDELSKKTKIDSVKNAIPVYKRYEFINSLFDGENMEYHQAILLVDQSESYETALASLKEKYAGKYNWNFSDKKVMELLDLVERRYL